MKTPTLLVILFLVFKLAFSQRESTNDFFHYYHNSPTRDYTTLLIAPGTMGPNALPIPDILNGQVGTDSQFKVSIDNYYRDEGDDNGHTFKLDFRFPVVQNFMAFGLEWNLIDYFRVTNEVRDIIQLYKDDPGWSTDLGDIILKTFIQLTKEKRSLPSAMLVSVLKTTSGSVFDGRYTDLPAHWHYASLGKKLINHEIFRWQLNAMLGYYFWQTNQDDLEQNEGPLWGIETQFNHKSLEYAFGISGYNGWKYYGNDKPIQFKARLILTNEKFNYFTEYKTGLRDYPYTSINIGINWHPLSPFKLSK